jgi:hypothetical protein
LGSAKHLLDRANQLTSHRPLTHDARNLDDLVERDVARVLDCAHGKEIKKGNPKKEQGRTEKERILPVMNSDYKS